VNTTAVHYLHHMVGSSRQSCTTPILKNVYFRTLGLTPPNQPWTHYQLVIHLSSLIFFTIS